MPSNRVSVRAAGLLLVLTAVTVISTACNLFQQLQQSQQQPTAGLALDPNSIGLILINETGVAVRADAIFRQGSFEVRRTTRLLAAAGQTATSEVIPTLATTLSIEAFEADTSATAKAGDLIATATLEIGKDFKAGDTVTFRIRRGSIETGVNRPPEGNPIPEITVASGAPVTLDASGFFSDPEGRALTFQWVQLTGPGVTLSGANTATVSFTAPIVPPTQTTSLSLQITATDDNAQSAKSTVNVLVVGPPVIAVSPSPSSQTVPVGGTASVSATVSGGVPPYTLVWVVAQAPGSNLGVFSAPNSASTNWTAPGTQLGTWTLQLQVTDAQGNHASGNANVSTGPDCNTNGILDSQEIAAGTAADCNNNGVPDACDIRSGVGRDCNGNGVIDACELAQLGDCNANGIPDPCELAVGALHDCDNNGVIDECDPNGPPDCPVIYCNPANGDCNGNGIWDACDILLGTSFDKNNNGVPDECEGGKG